MVKVVLLPMLHALGLTIVTEGLLVLIITRKKQWIIWSIVCNLLTNPLVNFIVLLVRLGVLKFPIAAVVAVLEILVVLSETVIYKFGIFGKSKNQFPQVKKMQANGEQVRDTQAKSAAGTVWLRCLGLSLLANAVSFGLGQLLSVLLS